MTLYLKSNTQLLKPAFSNCIISAALTAASSLLCQVLSENSTGATATEAPSGFCCSSVLLLSHSVFIHTHILSVSVSVSFVCLRSYFCTNHRDKFFVCGTWTNVTTSGLLLVTWAAGPALTHSFLFQTVEKLRLTGCLYILIWISLCWLSAHMGGNSTTTNRKYINGNKTKSQREATCSLWKTTDVGVGTDPVS